MAVAVYPPPGPREDKRTATDYILAGILILGVAAIIGLAFWIAFS